MTNLISCHGRWYVAFVYVAANVNDLNSLEAELSDGNIVVDWHRHCHGYGREERPLAQIDVDPEAGLGARVQERCVSLVENKRQADVWRLQ